MTEATSAEEALTLAIETEFALIVMDEIFAPGLEAKANRLTRLPNGTLAAPSHARVVFVH